MPATSHAALYLGVCPVKAVLYLQLQAIAELVQIAVPVQGIVFDEWGAWLAVLGIAGGVPTVMVVPAAGFEPATP